MHDLDFKFKPSRCYLILLTVVMIVSVSIIWYLSFAMRTQFLLLIVVLGYGGWLFWQFGLLWSPQAVLSVRRFKDGKWMLQTSKATYVADLRGDSTVTRFVSVLRFQPLNQFWTRSCIVFPDSLAQDRYRQLVIHCRLK